MDTLRLQCPECNTELYVADEGTFHKTCPCCKAVFEFRMGALEPVTMGEEEDEL